MKTGIDVFKVNYESIIKERNFVLITGSSNVDAKGFPVYGVVKELAGERLKAIWSLQHGFFVDKQDNMILSDSFYWDAMGIEVKSLYGEQLEPKEEWLDGVDALVVDVFDVGTRVYTFVNHLVMIMKTLSGKGIDVIVLDRPNPLTGTAFEGNVIEDDYFSIVGQVPVPMRHGLTAAEFLSFALNYHNIDLQLEVISIPDWTREAPFNGLWTYPSPNMPSFNTAVVYPGAVMLEGTNLSEGRGTTRPFEFVGAPFLDNFKLVRELEQLELKDVSFMPVFFKPEFSKFAGELCKGIMVIPKNVHTFRSFEVYYELIRWVNRMYPEQFKWKQPPYEFEYKRLPIDMIGGSELIRHAITRDVPFVELNIEIERQIEEYASEIDHFLLY